MKLQSGKDSSIMEKLALTALLLVIVLPGIFCPPVTKTPEPSKSKNDHSTPAPEEDVNFGLEYERYLKEVVNILETDEIFKKKLEESNISDIKSGAIAKHLEFVSHAVRTKLDELKRQEMDRLRNLIKIKTRNKQGKDGIPTHDLEKIVGHLDGDNHETFEENDLAKLVKKATQDLEDLDKKRKEEFKMYEMEKEHLKREKLKGMSEEERKAEEKRLEEMKEKHKKHPKLHHPGSKDQLEEVWEESDGLAKEDFDPKAFFMLHDTNSDGFWDELEVEALFQKELDKMYDPDAPEDDMMERYEEMSRMREHVLNEVDKNKDKLISMQEFIDSTKTGEFNKDDGWAGLDEEDSPYTEEELAAFEREQEQLGGHAQPGEVNFHGQGLAPPPLPPHLGGSPQFQQRPPGGFQPPPPMGHQGYPNQGYPNQGYPNQGYPNQPLQYQQPPPYNGAQPPPPYQQQPQYQQAPSIYQQRGGAPGGQQQQQQQQTQHGFQQPYQQQPPQGHQFQHQAPPAGQPVQFGQNNNQFQQNQGQNSQFQGQNNQNNQFQGQNNQNNQFQGQKNQNNQFQGQNKQQQQGQVNSQGQNSQGQGQNAKQNGGQDPNSVNQQATGQPAAKTLPKPQKQKQFDAANDFGRV